MGEISDGFLIKNGWKDEGMRKRDDLFPGGHD
jgi:hypothetical protein